MIVLGCPQAPLGGFLMTRRRDPMDNPSQGQVGAVSGLPGRIQRRKLLIKVATAIGQWPEETG